jgi:hypothetical protein
MYARGRVDGRTRRVAKKRRLPKLAFDRPPVLFLLFEKLSGVRTLATFYLAKNDHRWVTFVPLKTIKPEQGQSRTGGSGQVRDPSVDSSYSIFRPATLGTAGRPGVPCGASCGGRTICKKKRVSLIGRYFRNFDFFEIISTNCIKHSEKCIRINFVIALS